MFICKDGNFAEIESVRKGLTKGLSDNYYLRSREWPYKNIPCRILAEQLLTNTDGGEINDYKWWCFNGQPKYMYRTLKSKKRTDVFENFYDMDYNPVMVNHGFPRHTPEFEKPAEFEEMKRLASILSQGFPFLRIDFFDVDGHVYFSEFTFYDWAGMRPFKGDWDYEIGKLIDLK